MSFSIAGTKPLARDVAHGSSWQLLLLPTSILLGVIFVIPIVDLIQLSFLTMSGPGQVDSRLTVGNYQSFITDAFLLKILLRTCAWGCWLSSAV